MFKYRTLSGRCRSGCDQSGNVHVVDWDKGKALCGKAPTGKSAGWGEWDKDEPTCPKCSAKLARAALKEAGDDR